MAPSILVVDDDPVFRVLAASVLADSGLTVVGEADSVSAALSAAVRLKPTAVLVDVGLPDGDGFALARQLTTLPWQPLVVLTSVDGDAGSADEVQRSGARAFIPKADLPNSPLARLLGAE
ncbi:MAG TPA: response regulator [Solirubrobacteraceae bacterium]|nr:response regulator [Solirubrobacteraceae bacterium]